MNSDLESGFKHRPDSVFDIPCRVFLVPRLSNANTESQAEGRKPLPLSDVPHIAGNGLPWKRLLRKPAYITYRFAESPARARSIVRNCADGSAHDNLPGVFTYVSYRTDAPGVQANTGITRPFSGPSPLSPLLSGTIRFWSISCPFCQRTAN